MLIMCVVSDESTFSMNDTMNETSETSVTSTPEAEEEKPLTNGTNHSSDEEPVQEEEVVVSQAPAAVQVMNGHVVAERD